MVSCTAFDFKCCIFPHSACKIPQKLFDILSVMILRSLNIYWRSINSGQTALMSWNYLLRHLWNIRDNSIGILCFLECCLFPDRLGAEILENLPAKSTGSLMKSLNSSRGRVCFQQSHATVTWVISQDCWSTCVIAKVRLSKRICSKEGQGSMTQSLELQTLTEILPIVATLQAQFGTDILQL